jgi:hypothetical protein
MNTLHSDPEDTTHAEHEITFINIINEIFIFFSISVESLLVVVHDTPKGKQPHEVRFDADVIYGPGGEIRKQIHGAYQYNGEPITENVKLVLLSIIGCELHPFSDYFKQCMILLNFQRSPRDTIAQLAIRAEMYNLIPKCKNQMELYTHIGASLNIEGQAKIMMGQRDK